MTRFASWAEFSEANGAELALIAKKIESIREKRQVFPPADCVFKFTITPLEATRVVILGQDPYPTSGHATGLAFSAPADADQPASLRNICRELCDDLLDSKILEPVAAAKHLFVRDLTPWTERGVLLLNTALTVFERSPGSHAEIWREFTARAIAAVIDSASSPPHFVLWGSKARDALQAIVGEPRGTLDGVTAVCEHFVGSKLACTSTFSSHPSPMSAHKGFFGSRPFSRASRAVNATSGVELDWRLV